ncbi:hypothetical protein [Erythrobacter aureus]|uniref:Uncharacterized protein n=1 Tax=Erythrobacter aureus TaxID=2182384 RepID=A0A345YJB5_9SPHN|nr:hypothetical protein [Erythrobacter aureus]AXK44017.1 hypothetical protein DVR09_16315 [Erythrobacter aureus]
MPVQKLILQMTVMCDTDTLDEAVNAYDSMSLTEIAHSTDFGDDIGSGIKVVASQTILSPDRIKAELEAIGNDGEFFDMAIADMADHDDEGDDTEAQLGNQVPFFLTNGGAETTDDTKIIALFSQLGLKSGGLGLNSGEKDDFFYPLTEAEANYVAEDIVTALDGTTSALIGYSVLCRNTKCLAPQVEFQIDPEAASEESVLEYATGYAEAIRPRVEEFGGDVHIDRGIDNCVVVRLLVPIANAMALGSADAWKARLALLLTPQDLPVYLTNQCTEAAHGTKEQFDHLGLSYGEFDGEFYPLTDEEVRYIAEDEVTSLDGNVLAFIGYSALYRGQKFLMPSIELTYGDKDDRFATEQEALAFANTYVADLAPKLAVAMARARVDQSGDDRIVIQILIPFETAAQRGDLDSWKKYLSWLLFDPIKYDIIEEVRVEDDEYAVTISWIGEGNDGDFDPLRPYDVPLLRFDVDKRVGEDFEELENGSYCTQVPAYIPQNKRWCLARYILAQLDMGHTGKRDLEKLSWTNLGIVEDYMAAVEGNDNDSQIDDLDHRIAVAQFQSTGNRSTVPSEIHPLDEAELRVNAAGFERADEPGMAAASAGELDDLELVYEVDAKFLMTAGAYNGVVDKQNMADLINDRGVQEGDIDRMNIVEVRVSDKTVARASGPAE